MMDFEWANRRHWRSLWGGTQGFDATLDIAFDTLCVAYAEPHRAYHVLAHIDACLRLLWQSGLACFPSEVAIAIWFHDAIYDTRASDNEQRSAAWAEHLMRRVRVADDVAARVVAMILATDKHNRSDDGDTNLLLDLDLSIFGTSLAVYDAYAAAIRKEYSWVRDDNYADARARVLRSFAARPSIYKTQTFIDEREAIARENIARELATLGR